MLGGGATPDENHNEGEEETAGSVKPPNSAIEANYRESESEIQKLGICRGGWRLIDLLNGNRMEPTLNTTSVIASSALSRAWVSLI